MPFQKKNSTRSLLSNKIVEVIGLARNPYIELANAIVFQAALDYRDSFEYGNRREKHNLEKFFRSDWYDLLTDLDGEAIIEGIQKEYV